MDYYTANIFKIISVVALFLFVLCLVTLIVKKYNKKIIIFTALLTVVSVISALYFQHIENNPKLSTATDHKERYDLPESSSSEKLVSEIQSSASSDNTSSAKNEVSSSTETQNRTKVKSTQEEVADKLPKNVEYGYINKDDFKKDIDMYYSKEFSYVSVGLGDHDIIKTVKFDFRDVPLLSLDDVIDYVKDWTADDIQMKNKIDDKDYVYHSDKFNLDYEIKITTNSKSEITKFIVYPDNSLI